VAECIEQEIRSGRIFIPTKNKGFGGKKKDVDHIEARRTISKTTVLQTLHPKLPILTSTHIFLSKKLKPKVTKSTTKLKTDQEKIIK
jgi:hypothetical protein